jgi:hypothetical protein
MHFDLIRRVQQNDILELVQFLSEGLIATEEDDKGTTDQAVREGRWVRGMRMSITV